MTAAKAGRKSNGIDPKLVSSEQLAVAMGVAQSTIYGWTRKGIIRKTAAGKYRVDDCKRRKQLWDQQRTAAIEKQREQAEAGAEPQGLPANMLAAFENAQLLRVRTQREKLSLAKAQGDLVSRADVALAIGGVLALLRSQALAMGDQLAPRLIGLETVDEIRAVIGAYVDRMLSRVSTAEVLEEIDKGAAPPAQNEAA